MKTYVLILNNGERYEDYREWVAGLFLDKDKALSYALGNVSDFSEGFEIECWEIDGNRTGYIQYEKNGKGIWDIEYTSGQV